jgi:ABC-type branched-subunit amino acid transport system substrate-binding protein
MHLEKKRQLRWAVLIAISLCVAPEVQAVQAASPEAQNQLGKAMALYNAGHWSEAADAFGDFLSVFPFTSLSPEAHFRHAVCLIRLRDYKAARLELRAFLTDSPSSPVRKQATIEAAYAAAMLGQTQEAAQLLQPVLATLTDEDRRAEAPVLEVMAPTYAPKTTAAAPSAETLSVGQSDLTEIRKLIADVKSNRTGAQQELERAVDSRATFLDLATLYAENDTGSPAWGLVAAKIARVYLHLGDLAKAKEAADRAVRAGGNTHQQSMQEILDLAAQQSLVKPNLVGVILPVTGRFKPYGDQLQNGLNLAIGAGDNIQLLTRDSQGDPSLAVAAVEDLAKQGVIAIIGPVGTQEAIPAAVRAQELGIPMISLSRAEGVTQAGPFVFRNSLTNSAQGRALARYAAEVMNVKRAAILAPDIQSGQEVTGPFWDSFESDGGEVRGYETYAQDQTTFSGPLKKLVVHVVDRESMKEEADRIKATVTNAYRRKKLLDKLGKNAPPVIDFDVLLVPDYYKTVLQIAPALASEDVITNGCDAKEMERIKKTTHRDEIKTVTLLGTAGWDSPDLIARAGRYVQCAVVVDGFYINSARDPTKQFVSAYREKYNQDPGLLDAQAYDTGRIVRDIIQRVRPSTRQQFRDAIASVRRFPGATGETTFAPDREADKPLFFVTVDKAGFSELPVQISPEGIAASPRASTP